MDGFVDGWVKVKSVFGWLSAFKNKNIWENEKMSL